MCPYGIQKLGFLHQWEELFLFVKFLVPSRKGVISSKSDRPEPGTSLGSVPEEVTSLPRASVFLICKWGSAYLPCTLDVEVQAMA
jgi:hypothetical protein